jgi:hypothetical protein
MTQYGQIDIPVHQTVSHTQLGHIINKRNMVHDAKATSHMHLPCNLLF